MNHTIILRNYDMVTFTVSDADFIQHITVDGVVDEQTVFDPNHLFEQTEVKRSATMKVLMPGWGSDKLLADARGATFDYEGESWVVVSYIETNRQPPFAKGVLKAVCYFPASDAR